MPEFIHDVMPHPSSLPNKFVNMIFKNLPNRELKSILDVRVRELADEYGDKNSQ